MQFTSPFIVGNLNGFLSYCLFLFYRREAASPKPKSITCICLAFQNACCQWVECMIFILCSLWLYLIKSGFIWLCASVCMCASICRCVFWLALTGVWYFLSVQLYMQEMNKQRELLYTVELVSTQNAEVDQTSSNSCHN